jgi:cytochrome bd-type quinol oxidase subunit 2
LIDPASIGFTCASPLLHKGMANCICHHCRYREIVMQDMEKIGAGAPDTRTRILFYLAVGLAQGILLACLIEGRASLLERHPLLLMPVFLLVVLLPQALYYSQSADPRRRRGILCAVAVVAIVIGLYQGATFGACPPQMMCEATQSGQYFTLSLVLSLLLFIGVPALSVRADWRGARYQQWVDAALHAFGLLAQGTLILVLAWIVKRPARRITKLSLVSQAAMRRESSGMRQLRKRRTQRLCGRKTAIRSPHLDIWRC